MKKILLFIILIISIFTFISCNKSAEVPKYENEVKYEYFLKEFKKAYSNSVLKDFYLMDYVFSSYEYTCDKSKIKNNITGKEEIEMIEQTIITKNKYDSSKRIIKSSIESTNSNSSYKHKRTLYIYPIENGIAELYNDTLDYHYNKNIEFKHYVKEPLEYYLDVYIKCLQYGPYQYYYIDNNKYTYIYDNDLLSINQITITKNEIKLVTIIESYEYTKKYEYVIKTQNVLVSKNFD